MYYYGKNTIKGLVESKTNLEVIYLQKGFKDKNYIDYLRNNNQVLKFVESNELEKLAKGKNHQGVIAKGFEYTYTNVDEIISKNQDNENSVVVILDGLEDPQNFGSIIRTGEALNISGIVIPKNRSVSVNPTVAKVSTGAINEVSIAQETNLRAVVKKLKDNGYWVVSADMDTDVLYDQVDYKMKVALIIGSEGKGISMQLNKESDFVVKLPMYGNVSSLNAAVSTAIILYQINSNRHQ
ncbi:MAG: 23S rRNA (guanosine(2251)-2'-O)-methyltransferase RlmB [Erysipelotrichales bacterium]